MNFNEIKNDAKKMRALTFLLPDEFETLLPKFQDAFDEYMQKNTFSGKIRLNKYAPRTPKYLTSIEEKLFFILVFYKQHPTQEMLAFSFGMEQAWAGKWISILMPILEQTLQQFKAQQKAALINDVLLEDQTYLLDVTERPVLRDTYEQEQFYSGKKKTQHQKFSHY